MGAREPCIDAYIAKQQDFAKPILTHIRAVVHAACPDVHETLKWSSPYFDYRGGMMCGMAAFKEHEIFGFGRRPDSSSSSLPVTVASTSNGSTMRNGTTRERRTRRRTRSPTIL